MLTVPNCGVLTKRFGVPRLTLFNALKASPRNWKLSLFVMRNARCRAMSLVCKHAWPGHRVPTDVAVRASQEMLQAIACLTCTVVLWVHLDGFGASEFSCGRRPHQVRVSLSSNY
jgi:hypothetical protein